MTIQYAHLLSVEVQEKTTRGLYLEDIFNILTFHLSLTFLTLEKIYFADNYFQPQKRNLAHQE